MTTVIDRSTLQLDGTKTAFIFGVRLNGTVEATLAGKTRRVRASVWEETPDAIYAHGISGRYQTGSKAWPATVILYGDGREHIQFGRDERAGRCTKTSLHFVD